MKKPLIFAIVSLGLSFIFFYLIPPLFWIMLPIILIVLPVSLGFSIAALVLSYKEPYADDSLKLTAIAKRMSWVSFAFFFGTLILGPFMGW